MVGQEDEIAPETLASDVVVLAVSETMRGTDGVSGVKVSDVSVEGFDINTPLDEDGITTGAITAFEQSEIKVDTTMRLGPGGLDFGLVEPESDGGSVSADVLGSLTSAPKDVETGLIFGLVEPEISGPSADAVVHESSLISASKEVETEPDFGSVEPKSNGVSVNADVHESVIRSPKDGETGLDSGLGEPDSYKVSVSVDVHGSLTSIPKDVVTGLDFGLGEPKSNGDSVCADVHGSLTNPPKDVETGPELGLVEPESNGVLTSTPKDVETGLDFGLVEPKSNENSADTDVHGSHVSTLKDVETGKDIDLVEPDSNGDSVDADVHESHISTIKDVETGPDFGLVEPKFDGVSVGADDHESLIGASKDVETGTDIGLVEPESNGVPVSTDVHGSLISTPKDVETKPVFSLVEPESNGVSLSADVHGSLVDSPKGVETDSGNEVNASVTDTAADCDVINPRTEELHGDSDVEMDGETEGHDTDDSIEEHDYSVGDIVWGKVKSHPWWPGQIYDSSDASSDAMKYKPNGRLLVAYYGDGTFAWCLPSQLIPFAENFEDMSKQSGSKNYLNAVTEAVDEIGRLVDLALTCPCVPEDNRKGLARLPVVNAGIKPGVIAPDGDIGNLLSFRYDPSEILATVAISAKTVSFANKLELSILKGWLSSFYRTKGGFSLPRYHEPVLVEGLEDKSKTGDIGAADVSVPLQGPVEEECGSFSHLLENIVNRRKQRSVAELVASGIDTTPKNTKSERKVSNSANKKRKPNVEDGSCSDIIQDCPTRRKRSRKHMDKMSPEYGVSSEEKLQESSMPKESLEVDIPGENDEGGDTKRFEEKFSPRERKKSKYLSLPYTSPHSRVGYPSYKDEEWEESEKITRIAKVGERMTKAAVQLLDSTPLKCNGETEKKEAPIVYSREKAAKSAELITKKTGKKDHDSNGVEEILSGLKSLGAGPLNSVSASVLELTRASISAFRSSMYSNGESYKIYHKRQPNKTTESVNFEFENLVDGSLQTLTGVDSPADQARGKKRKCYSEILEKKLDAPKPKRVARCSSTKKGNNLEEVVEKSEVPLASSLVLTFDPAFPLPTKGEIIETFSKFGNINENETDVVSESRNVKIVYMKGGCVEEALRASLCEKPFFSGIVDYKLCYTQMLQ